MAISHDINDREHKKLIESSSVPGQVGIVVLNPDGSNVSGGTGSGDGTIIDGVSSSIKATVFDKTNSNPLATALVDANGDQITSFGGGTQYADGATAATPTGTQINWNESGTQRAVSASKPLPVDTELPAAASLADSTDTPTAPAVGAFLMGDSGSNWDKVRVMSPADGVSSTNGTLKTANFGLVYSGSDWNRIRQVTNGMDSSGIGVLAAGLVGQRDDTSTGTVTENQFAPVRITPSRALHSSIYTPNGDSAMDDTMDSVKATLYSAGSEITTGNPMVVEIENFSTTLPAGSNLIGKVQLSDGTTHATVRDLSGADALNVSVVDGDGNQITSFGGNLITGIGHGVTTVTTAGTDVVLASSTACKKVVIQSQTDNTGLIAVGASGVDATIATGTGIILYPGDSFEIEIDNLNDIYIDSTVSGEGVRYTYFT